MLNMICQYPDMRNRFLETCQESISNFSVAIESVNIPSKTEQKILFTDIVTFKKSPPSSNLVLISSGVHGAEAYAGSMLQTALVKKVLPTFHSQNTDITLLHCLNPYGALHGRRTTESNIDLNRHFGQFNANKDMANNSYLKLKHILEPNERLMSRQRKILSLFFEFLYLKLIHRQNVNSLQNNISGGQNISATGLFYAGTKSEPQVALIHSIVEASKDQYKNILILDIHTGLGEKAILHVIPDLPRSVFDEHNAWLPAKQDTYRISFDEDKDFYTVHGDLPGYLSRQLTAHQCQTQAYTLEYGTLGDSLGAKLDSLARLILENQIYNNNASHIKLPQFSRLLTDAKHDFLQMFAPQNAKWQEAVYCSGIAFFRDCLARFDQV